MFDEKYNHGSHSNERKSANLQNEKPIFWLHPSHLLGSWYLPCREVCIGPGRKWQVRCLQIQKPFPTSLQHTISKLAMFHVPKAVTCFEIPMCDLGRGCKLLLTSNSEIILGHLKEAGIFSLLGLRLDCHFGDSGTVKSNEWLHCHQKSFATHN